MTRSSQLPDFVLRVNGATLPYPAQQDVRAVTVEQGVGEPAWFSVELSNWDAEKLQVSWSDGTLFAIGNSVEISLGFVDDLHRVLVGEVTSLEPVFSAQRPPVLVVSGYDVGHRLARAPKSRTFARMKDSAIAAQVAREAGLRAEVRDTKVSLLYVAQANQTDWAFLRDRADRIGYELFVREKVLHFRPPAADGSAQRTLALGEEITEFRPRLSAVGQVGGATVQGWDVLRKQALVGQAAAAQIAPMGATSPGLRTVDKAFGRSAAIRVDLGPGIKAEADQIALGALTGTALDFVSGTVECAGQPQLVAGSVVTIEDAGNRFSGPYYIAAVTHTLDAHGYRTTLAVQRNA
jgi:phage protein D